MAGDWQRFAPDDQSSKSQLFRQYEQETDTQARAAILEQLRKTLTPAEQAAGEERFLAWLDGAPPNELRDSPDFSRYNALLPQILSESIDPGSAEYAEFMSYVQRWQFCADDFAELQRMADELASPREVAAATPDVPRLDLAFMGQSLAERAAVVWSAVTGRAQEVVKLPGQTQLRFPFDLNMSLLGGAQAAGARGDLLREPARDLLQTIVESDSEQGLTRRYRVVVRAEQESDTTCTLLVDVRVIGARRGTIGVLVTIERPWQDALTATTTKGGLATFAQVPIEDLDGLTVQISLPQERSDKGTEA